MGSWSNDLYVQATITANIGSNQCSGKKIIKKKLNYGNIFSLQYTDVDATHFNVSVTTHQSGNQYSWAMDNVNFGSLTTQHTQFYLTKTTPLDPAEYFKVRVYPNGCSSYYELQGQYWREGIQQPQPMSATLEIEEEISISPNHSSTMWSVFMGNSYNDEYADIKI